MLTFENGKPLASEPAAVIASHSSGLPNALASASLATSLVEIDKRLSALAEVERAKRIRSLRESLCTPEFRVVVFGEFSRGKSTLINAVIGRVVMPAQLIPTTGHVTRIMFGSKDEVRVHHADGELEICALKNISEFSSLNIHGVARENVDSIEVAVNSPMLESGMIFIDTPGVNDRDAQTRRAKAAIAEADLVIFLLDARQILSSAERELAVEWLAKDLRKPLVPVVNFMNFVEAGDREELIQIVERWSKEHLDSALSRPWFAVDARGALKHALGEGAPPDDDFRLLCSQLAGLTGHKREISRSAVAMGNCSQRSALRARVTSRSCGAFDKTPNASNLKGPRHAAN
jgi:GTPase SAR1 family protein